MTWARHKFVSAKTESPDNTLVSVAEWNDTFLAVSGTDGFFLQRATGDVDGAAWVNIHAIFPTVDVTKAPYNAVGNGIADDFTAINSAINSGAKDILFPAGTYKVSAMLTLLSGQRLIGLGGQRTSTIEKAFNGNLIQAASLCEITNLNLDCKGASFTGRGIDIPASSFSIKLNRLRIIDSVSECIFFAANSGGGTIISELEANTTVSLTVPVISGTGDSTATPRFIHNCWISGGFINISAWNDTLINNCYVHNILTSSTTANFYIGNVRFALGGVTLTIFGSGGMFSNCSFAGPVILQNSSGLRFSNSCEFGFGCTEGSGALFNAFTDQSTAFTPTWTQSSGTQPALGNGTITGRYLRMDRVCHVQIVLTMGSTTTFGNSSVGYQFSIPFFSHNAAGFVQRFPGCCEVLDLSVPQSYVFHGTINNNELAMTLSKDGAGLRDGYPVAWATGDTVTISLVYQTR